MLVLVLLLFFGGASYAEMYKWVDEKGKVYYGDCPPADCKPEKIETAPGPSEEDIQQSRERAERLIQEQKKRDVARKIEREFKQKQAEQRRVALKKKCKVLRSRLFLLKQSGVLTFADNQGNIMRPTDDERERMISKIETFIRQNCE
jgi:hypothetical protein